MEIVEIKKIMREKGITQIELAEKSNIPLQTLRKIFSGNTTHPRIDTMQAIERALGITTEPNLTAEQKELFELIQSLDDEEVKQLDDYLSFILSKRTKK